MLAKFYDVIVVGENLAGLIAAALLAGRKYSVLLIRQMTPPGGGSLYGSMAHRQKNNYPGIFDLPVPATVLRELNLGHKVRGSFKPISPLFQILSAGHRLTVFSDRNRFFEEIRREFGKDVKSSDVSGLFRRLDDVGAVFDRFLTPDLPYHPDGMKQKWNLSRREKEFDSDLDKVDGLIESLTRAFEKDSTGRLMAAVEGNAGQMSFGFDSIFAYRRAKSLFQEVLYQVEGESIDELFTERIKTRNGTVIDSFKLQEFDKKKGTYHFSDSKGTYSSQNLIAATDLFSLPDLFNDQKLEKYVSNTMKDIRPTHVWLKLNLLLDRNVIPEGMEFYLYQFGRNVQNESEMLAYYRDPLSGDDMDVERLEIRQPIAIDKFNAEGCRQAQQNMLEQVRQVIPFMDDHLRKVYLEKPPAEGQSTSSLNRIAGRDLLYGSYKDTGLFRGVSYHLPWKNAYLAGPEVLPELGFEGDFITG